MQDHEMIKRIRQGDKALFGQLAEKYYDDVFRYCYYHTGSEQAACDCAQETFYHLMRFLDSYAERKRFKAYLFRIALNVCRDYHRKSGNRDISYEENAEAAEMASGVSQEGQVETRLLIQGALDGLPEVQREVIILFFYQGYRQREIARITGAPLSTVKTRLRAGIKGLRERLRESGLL